MAVEAELSSLERTISQARAASTYASQSSMYGAGGPVSGVAVSGEELERLKKARTTLQVWEEARRGVGRGEVYGVNRQSGSGREQKAGSPGPSPTPLLSKRLVSLLPVACILCSVIAGASL